jgi:hypothetical protein
MTKKSALVIALILLVSWVLLLMSNPYYDCIGKTPIVATLQLISVGHEVRDREFILRYNLVLDS